MSAPDRQVPERELRNEVARLLREVEAGARLRVTVRGRPVADLVPVSPGRTFVPRSELRRILREAPLDQAFERDVEAVAGATIEEM